MRVGFACAGYCSGGSWHGVGGFVEIESTSKWLKYSFMATIVLGLASAVYLVVNAIPYFLIKTKGYNSLLKTKRPEAQYV